MLYTSELNGKSYKTIKELEAAEAEIKKQEQEKAALAEVKKTRAKEVQTAYEEYLAVRKEAYSKIAEAEKKYLALRDSFAKDYKGYHCTYTYHDGREDVTFEDLVQAIIKAW